MENFHIRCCIFWLTVDIHALSIILARQYIYKSCSKVFWGLCCADTYKQGGPAISNVCDKVYLILKNLISWELLLLGWIFKQDFSLYRLYRSGIGDSGHRLVPPGGDKSGMSSGASRGLVGAHARGEINAHSPLTCDVRAFARIWMRVSIHCVSSGTHFRWRGL